MPITQPPKPSRRGIHNQLPSPGQAWRLCALAAFSLLLAASSDARPIYKHVDAQGNVSYSDSPQDKDAKAMELPPINTQSSENLQPQGTPTPPQLSEQADYSISIDSPSNDVTIPPGQASVTVSAVVQPNPEFTARYELVLDGEFSQSSSAPVFNIEPLYRGTHTLSIRMIDEYGVNIASSESVTIHVQRPTVSR
ncbi:DUF4124 domain-containing protein [Halioxenophilus aromaticivorans]|uniref:DUF4124 domain-containing protein n=1 Tax=Halioxenophilus aromaticivorans TaxID=1306992 RepID=A0AAV3U4X5_9ALTE